MLITKARTTPEPIFDLADCGLAKVPSGIYSLCRVFLKQSLLLNNNKLTSLTHGGALNDLRGIQILHLSYNSFTSLPEELVQLVSLKVSFCIHLQFIKHVFLLFFVLF